MTTNQIISYLKKQAVFSDKQGMTRFGIDTRFALGVRIPVLRSLAKKLGRDHKLALELWKTKIHEARILASMIDEFDKVTKKQMDSWIKGFNSWDICDQVCMNLFFNTPHAWSKVFEWVKKEKEFERRAGFALMAVLAWKDKKAKDKDFLKFFPLIKKYSFDERNFVKKAVNWALRQIGKRNVFLRKQAIKTAKEILKMNTVKWIAKDALEN